METFNKLGNALSRLERTLDKPVMCTDDDLSHVQQLACHHSLAQAAAEPLRVDRACWLAFVRLFQFLWPDQATGLAPLCQLGASFVPDFSIPQEVMVALDEATHMLSPTGVVVETVRWAPSLYDDQGNTVTLATSCLVPLPLSSKIWTQVTTYNLSLAALPEMIKIKEHWMYKTPNEVLDSAQEAIVDRPMRAEEAFRLVMEPVSQPTRQRRERRSWTRFFAS
jgi:hypothetical protein